VRNALWSRNCVLFCRGGRFVERDGLRRIEMCFVLFCCMQCCYREKRLVES